LLQHRTLSSALVPTETATRPIARTIGTVFGRRFLRVSVTFAAAITTVASYLVLTTAVSISTANAVVDPACTFTMTPTLWTLNATCDTTAPLPPIPDGVTVDGAGNTINFSDPPGGHFSGAVLSDAPGAASMNIENLTIDGPPAGLAVPIDCTQLLFGILFTNASGTVNNVHINNVFQQPDGFGNCNIGHAIRANGFTAPMHTVTITNTTVTGYQKGGFTASGADMTMNVSNSTVGPPAALEGYIAPNGVQYGGSGPNEGAGGTISNSTIFGSGDRAPTPPGNASGGDTDATAVLLFAAKNVTVTHNTITGAKTNIGVWDTTDTFVTPPVPSTGVVISFNQIGRTAPDSPDPTGYGIDVDPSQATLICNTFSGWNTNILGAIQVGCTPLPNGTCQTVYTANLPTVEGGTPPFAWSASGPLPPGLTLASSGAISGTPTATGTFAFSATVIDSSSPPFTVSQDQTITIAGSCPATGPSSPAATLPASPSTTPPASSPVSATPVSASPGTTSSSPLAVTGLNLMLPIVGIFLVVFGSVLTYWSRRMRHKLRLRRTD